MTIHPTAIIDPKAELDSSVEVGPFSIIGPHVRMQSGCKVGPHMHITGHTTIGRDNVFYGYSAIGGDPQDKKYKGEPTRLVIGDRNTIREFCTFNTGTAQDRGATEMGDDNWIMAYVHIAHDCVVGSNTIFANNTTLAGHVTIGNWVILAGFTGVHQFVRVGDHSMTSIAAKVVQDIPPFVLTAGNPSAPFGINSEGLKRRGFSPEAIARVKAAYKIIYRKGLSLEEAKAALFDDAGKGGEGADSVHLLAEFLASSTRGILR